MHFIKEIFSGEAEKAHEHFVRYGKGRFEGPIIRITKSKNAVRIDASIDYVNSIISLLSGFADCRFEVSGKIVSKWDIEAEIATIGIAVEKTKKSVFFAADVADVVDCKKLAALSGMNGYLLLDVTSDKGVKLKTKKNPPKPGKVDDKFCSAILGVSSLKRVLDEFCFEGAPADFKNIDITHTYVINELVVPEEYKNDPATARIKAKRKGALERSVNIDGNVRKTNVEFTA